MKEFEDEIWNIIEMARSAEMNDTVEEDISSIEQSIKDLYLKTKGK